MMLQAWFGSMPLSAAEKTRRYRARLQEDEERLAAVREKDRRRWHERKEVGKSDS